MRTQKLRSPPWRTNAYKSFSFLSWRRSKCSLHVLPTARDSTFLISAFAIRSNSFSPHLFSDINWRVTWIASRSFTSDLMTCYPWYNLGGCLDVKYQNQLIKLAPISVLDNLQKINERQFLIRQSLHNLILPLSFSPHRRSFRYRLVPYGLQGQTRWRKS